MLISYFGGKKIQSKWIYSQITKDMKKNIKTFTEVFAGAFWVYINNDFSFCNKIIYNDINIYLTNFFACIREPKFIEYLKKQYEPGKILYFDQNVSKDQKKVYEHNYNKFKEIFMQYRQELYRDMLGKEIKINIPDIEIAFKYGFMLRHAFSGIPSEKIGFSYSASSYKEGKKAPEPKSQILLRNVNNEVIQNKLKKVTAFETFDFQKHIEKYDSKQTLFYADPPYYNHEGDYFRGNEHFGLSGHQRLADTLKSIDGKFILSYYDFEGLDKLYPKDKFYWKIKEFTKATTSIKKSDGSKKGAEILIMNYQPEEKQIEREIDVENDNFWS